MSNTTQMACSSCGYAYSKAKTTSRRPDGSVRRERKCLKCDGEFVTYEVLASDHALLTALRKWRANDNHKITLAVQGGA